ncbi:MAG: NAD(P)-binding oxidoreductase [Pseudomonadota bacterium]
MKVVVLGANGRTGRLVVERALEEGHTVTAVVRSAKTLSDFQHEMLRIKEGDVCDTSFLGNVLRNHDAVVSALGPRLPTKRACRIYIDSATAISEAMKETGLRQVLIVSTALLFPPEGFLDRLLRLVARNNFAAAGRMEEVIQSADLEWTFARVGFLNDSSDWDYEAISGARAPTSNSVSRLAVADFLVGALEQRAFQCEVVGLGSVGSSTESTVRTFANH